MKKITILLLAFCAGFSIMCFELLGGRMLAPLFAILVGILFLQADTFEISTRWTNLFLATTHGLTLGFMLMVMLGALFQILPVVLGVSMPKVKVLSRLVHLFLTIGITSLVFGLYLSQSPLLIVAMFALIIALSSFFIGFIFAISSMQNTASGWTIRLAALSLIITVCFGLLFTLGWVEPDLIQLDLVQLDLISLVPNIIPAAMAYGLWGMTYGYVDISLSIVACSTLGIVVDDTVHFLHKYIRARKSGLNSADSVREAFQKVGLALLTTSMVLAGGFIILAISHMNTSATIGILMATTLVIALIVDFLLLPPLLIFLDKDKDKDKVKNINKTLNKA